MNYYRRYIGDFQADTMALSMLEQGAYDRLLDYYYATEKPIPLNTDRAAIICRAVTLQDRAAVQAVLETYFERREDGWHNARADKEIALANGRVEGATEAGRSGGLAKWGSNRAAAQTRAQRLKAAREQGTHTDVEWSLLVDFCQGLCVRCGRVGDDRPLVKDHIKPIYQGGSDAIGNIQPLCRSCNSSKGPDNTDHRPSGWADYIASKMPSNSSSNTPHSPTTNHHTKPKPPCAVSPHFGRFWDSWPSSKRKVAKSKCAEVWHRRALDAAAAQIIAHVEAMKGTEQWRTGYEPSPLTYLNQRRWEDGMPGSQPRERRLAI